RQDADHDYLRRAERWPLAVGDAHRRGIGSDSVAARLPGKQARDPVDGSTGRRAGIERVVELVRRAVRVRSRGREGEQITCENHAVADGCYEWRLRDIVGDNQVKSARRARQGRSQAYG